jgi:hypothetical protein
LVTLGTHQAFDPAWREVKNACSGTDTALTMSRIHSNKRQSHVFNSVQKPGGASDEETIELIRRLHDADRFAVRALRERDPGYRAMPSLACVWP